MKTSLTAATSGSSADPHRSASLLPISGMSFAQSASVDAVECPQCGKRSIVERSSNIFDCLNCGFHRELPPIARQSGLTRSTRSPRLGSPRQNASTDGQRDDFSPQTLLSLEQDHTMTARRHPQKGVPLSSRHASPRDMRVAQHSRFNSLLSSDVQHASLDRFALDMGEEMAEADKSQPWIFAVIAVIFGILLL